jgi:hypothetical protein
MEGIIRVDVRNDGVQSSVTIVATDKEKVRPGHFLVVVLIAEIHLRNVPIGDPQKCCISALKCQGLCPEMLHQCPEMSEFVS